MTIDFQRVRDSYRCTDVVARYCPDLKQKGSQFWAICPFHDDHHPTNFTVYMDKKSVERWRCFVCDDGGDVIDFVARIENCNKQKAVELITGEALPNVGEYKRPALKPSSAPAWIPIIPVPDRAPKYQPEITWNARNNTQTNYKKYMTRLDPYFDAEGRLIFYVMRRDFPDGVKMCPQITYCAGPDGEERWCARRMDPPYPLMGLDALTARPKDYVMLVSGEKCKMEHDKNAPAYIAVTWLGGDQCVDSVDFSPLYGRKVVYYSDHDESGRRAMKKAFEKIEKSGTG